MNEVASVKSQRFAGKVAVITGGGSGIGLATHPRGSVRRWQAHEPTAVPRAAPARAPRRGPDFVIAGACCAHLSATPLAESCRVCYEPIVSSTKRPPLLGMCGALALLASCSSTPAPSASSAGGTAGTSSAGQGGAGATGGTAATGGAGLAGNAGSSTGGTESGGAGGLAGNAGSSTGGTDSGGAGGLAGSAGSSTGGAGASGADGGPSTCAKPYASGRRSLTLVVAGTTRRFLLYVPKGYVGTTPLPLVFNLHPTGTSPESNEDSTRMETFADQRGFMVVALEGINRVWNVALDPSRPSDVAFAEAVLDFANTNLCIVNGRVYSTGMSGGARMSSRFACALGKRIAA